MLQVPYTKRALCRGAERRLFWRQLEESEATAGGWLKTPASLSL